MDGLKRLLLLLSVLFATPVAAQQCGTLTSCPPATTLSGSELMYLVQNGTSKKITTGQFFTFTGPYLDISTLTGRITPSQMTALTGDCYSSASSNVLTCPSQAATQVTFQTKAAFTTASIPSAITTVHLLTYGNNPSGCPLDYTRGTSTPTGVWGESFVSGVYWEPVYSTSPIRACQWGTVADGSYNGVTGVAAGTDNAPAIQAALDYAMQNSYAYVCLNEGRYATGDTIQMGWGQSYQHLELTACSGLYGRYEGAMAGGVAIYPTKTDRCAINVQGGRVTRVAGISLLGANLPWVNNIVSNATNAAFTPSPVTASSGTGSTATLTYSGANIYPVGSKILVQNETPSGYNGAYIVTASSAGMVSFASTTTGSQSGSGTIIAVGFPATPSAWLNPALTPSGNNPGGLQINSPYAGFCIDAYKGAQPSDPYPTVTYPAWTGIGAAQYNKNASSDTTFEGGDIGGFAVNAMMSPNGDGNGDFSRVINASLFGAPYLLAVGNAQARNTEMRDVNTEGYFAAVTNRAFGLGQGRLQGTLENVSGGQGFELFDINLAAAESFAPKFWYAEAQQRVGYFTNIANATPAYMEHFTISLTSLGMHEAAPALIEADPGANFVLDDFSVSNGARVPIMVHSSGQTQVSWRGGFVNNGQSITVAADATGGVQAAFNWTGGLFLGPVLNPGPSSSVGVTQWSGNGVFGQMATATSAPVYNNLMSPVVAQQSNTSLPLTQAMSQFRDRISGRVWSLQQPLPRRLGLNGAAGYVTGAPYFSACDTLTYTLLGGAQSAPASGQFVGELLYFPGVGGTLYAVTSLTPSGGNWIVTATQLNNMVVDRSTGACLANNVLIDALTTAGVYASGFVTNVQIPPVIQYGNCTSGSANVTSVTSSSSSGDSSWLTTAASMQTGARFWPNQFTDSYFGTPFFADGTTIASETQGSPASSTPGSLTLSANALQSGRCMIFPIQLN